MNEIIFVVDEAVGGGYTARALGESIFTQADDLQSLQGCIRDAVRCHFSERDTPKMVRLHLVKGEVIAL